MNINPKSKKVTPEKVITKPSLNSKLVCPILIKPFDKVITRIINMLE